MPFRIDDRWLWLGFGVFIITAGVGIRYAIEDIKDLTVIEPFPIEDGYEYQDMALLGESTRRTRRRSSHNAEGVGLPALKTLASSTNPNIANVATSLVVEQFIANPNAREMLSRDLRSPSRRTREQACKTIRFLKAWSPDAGNVVRGLPDRFATPAMLSGRSVLNCTGDDDDLVGVSIPITSAEYDHHMNRATSSISLSAPPRSGTPPPGGWNMIPRERPVRDRPQNDPEEAELRRSRREAMVLHEGSGVVDEDDIFRPSEA